LSRPFAAVFVGSDSLGWQGTWQGPGAIPIFYTEFDGQRAKRLVIKVLGGRSRIPLGKAETSPQSHPLDSVLEGRSSPLGAAQDWRLLAH
jgi:hypothetical protein